MFMWQPGRVHVTMDVDLGVVIDRLRMRREVFINTNAHDNPDEPGHGYRPMNASSRSWTW